MTESVARALLARRHTVWGRSLQPFNVLHRAYLQAISHPQFTGEPLTPAAILLAVRVCSVSDPRYLDLQIGWREKLCTFMAWLRPGYADRQLIGWLAYLSDHTAMPRLWVIENGQQDPVPSTPSPEELDLLTVLTQGGLTLVQAQTMSLGLAYHFYFAHLIRKGARLQFMSPDEIARADAPEVTP